MATPVTTADAERTQFIKSSPYYTLHHAAMEFTTSVVEIFSEEFQNPEATVSDVVTRLKSIVACLQNTSKVLRETLEYQQDPKYRCTNCKTERARYLVTYKTANGKSIDVEDYPHPERLCHLACKPNGWQYGSWDWKLTQPFPVQYINEECGGGNMVYDAEVSILSEE